MIVMIDMLVHVGSFQNYLPVQLYWFIVVAIYTGIRMAISTITVTTAQCTQASHRESLAKYTRRSRSGIYILIIYINIYTVYRPDQYKLFRPG